jgi:hypothetical protein
MQFGSAKPDRDLRAVYDRARNARKATRNELAWLKNTLYSIFQSNIVPNT